MAHHHYFLGGLRIHSTMPLRHASPVEALAEADVDVCITVSEKPIAVPAGLEPISDWIHAGRKQVYFSLDGIGQFLVDDGHSIHVHPVAGCPWEEIEAYLLGTAMAIIYHQRRIHPLHAACLAKGEVAVALAGESGEGKTTMAMAVLQQQGYSLLTDDVVPLEIRPDGLQVHSEKPVLKLWRQTAEHFDVSVEELAAITRRDDKYYLPTDPQPQSSCYLRHLVVLVSDDELAEPVLEEASKLEALAHIRQHTHRGFLVPAIWGEADFFKQTVAVAAALTVWRLRRPRVLARIDDSVRLLEPLYAA